MNVSFGSSYLINEKPSTPSSALEKIYDLELQGAKIYQKFTPFPEISKTGIYSKINIVTPEDMDKMIENILISNNIDFHKTTKEEALNLENIRKRIIVEPCYQDKFSLVEIDTNKLDELFKKDKMAYIEPQGKNGISNRYADFIEYLETNEEIHATRVFFNKDDDGNLTATVGNGRHRFAVLRDMGMKKIPVALDKYSIELAKEYGLIPNKFC